MRLVFWWLALSSAAIRVSAQTSVLFGVRSVAASFTTTRCESFRVDSARLSVRLELAVRRMGIVVDSGATPQLRVLLACWGGIVRGSDTSVAFSLTTTLYEPARPLRQSVARSVYLAGLWESHSGGMGSSTDLGAAIEPRILEALAGFENAWLAANPPTPPRPPRR